MGLGEVAAVVGIAATLMGGAWALMQRRVRLRVTPMRWEVPGRTGGGLSVEVVNLSTFPVTIEEIGLVMADGRRVVFQGTAVAPQGRLPAKIEPHERVTAHWELDRDVTDALAVSREAYARTSSDVRATGTSPAFLQLVDMAREIVRANTGPVGGNMGL